ncbi:hypothetical protein R1flu_017401 [Riccia fluitans]|uniref:Uncharacterized protein n=1 Tax=Riccia fluitans TaxID=41844 RepID=A0ABD1ZCZ5_9MARC
MTFGIHTLGFTRGRRWSLAVIFARHHKFSSWFQYTFDDMVPSLWTWVEYATLHNRNQENCALQTGFEESYLQSAFFPCTCLQMELVICVPLPVISKLQEAAKLDRKREIKL